MFPSRLLCQGCRLAYISGGQQARPVPHARGAPRGRPALGGRVPMPVSRAVGGRALPGGGARVLQGGAERQGQGAQATPERFQVHGQAHQQRFWQEEEIGVRRENQELNCRGLS